MPYKISKDGDQWCVYNTDTNESKGCSDTRDKAVGHLRALYAVAGAEAKSKEFNYYDMWGMQLSQSETNYGPLAGTNEKACANCRWFASPDGCMLVYGDISPTGLCDRWEAVPEYTMQPMPVEIVNSKSDENIIQRAISYVLELLLPQQETIKLKELDNGQLRFFMPYTNNFQDRHDEIYAKHAHKEYEQWADTNNAYPEVWLWHVPGSRWGQCDYIAYDDTTGFGFCSGLVDPGCEHIARNLVKSKDIGVSHSHWSVQRGDVVERYYTYEISPLPLSRAANTWHEGVKLLEANMGLAPEKRAWLAATAGEEFVQKVEKDYATRAEQLAQQNVKSREAEGVDQVDAGLTLDAITEVLQAAISPLQQQMVTLTETQTAHAAQLDEIKSKQLDLDQQAEKLFGTPRPDNQYVASEQAKSKAAEGSDDADSQYEWLTKSKAALQITPAGAN